MKKTNELICLIIFCFSFSGLAWFFALLATYNENQIVALFEILSAFFLFGSGLMIIKKLKKHKAAYPAKIEAVKRLAEKLSNLTHNHFIAHHNHFIAYDKTDVSIEGKIFYKSCDVLATLETPQKEEAKTQ